MASLSCLDNAFVWNSDELIKHSETRSLKSALRLFSPSVWAGYRGDSGENYHPVAALTFWLDHALWGVASWGCHLSNLLLHIATSVLVAVIARHLTGSNLAAMAAGLLFAVHPAHVESVNWLKNRSQLTAILLATGAIGLAALPRLSCWRAMAASACLAAALLAQEQAVGAAVVIAYVCWRNRDANRRASAWTSAIVLAVAAVYVCLRLTELQFKDKVGIPLHYRPERTDLEPVLATLLFYVSKAILPLSQSIDYGSELLSSGQLFRSPWVLAALGFTAALGLRAGKRTSLSAAVWFFATVAPASNVIPILGRPLAEQRLYFPSMGACLLVAVACVRRARGEIIPRVLLGLAVLAMTATTLQRNLVWRRADGLWRHAVKASPQNERPRFNLAQAYGEVARRTVAKHELRQALRAEPTAGGHVYMAYLAHEDADYGTAERHLLKAVRIDDAPDTRLNLALVYKDTRRYREALEQTEAALALDPRFFGAKIAAGEIYAKLGQAKDAIQTYLAAAALDKTSPIPYLCIADLERTRGHLHQAANYYKEARDLAPNHLPTLLNEAYTYRLLQAQAVRNNDSNVAIVYGRTARRMYERMLDIDPRHVSALVNLAQLAEDGGDVITAVRHYHRALGIDPYFEPAKTGLRRLRGAH